ncbi:MAG: capsule assembly Wzi family protein [Bacteroidota bacterium]
MACTSEPGLRLARRLLPLCLLVEILAASPVWAQAENVPATHPVYPFLKRLEVRGLIGRYFDHVLPLSRREVARLLEEAEGRRGELTGVEAEYLEDLRSEFRFDRTGSLEGVEILLGESGGGSPDPWTRRERFLWAGADSTASFFANGLLDLDARTSRESGSGFRNAAFVQFGARARGTIGERLGYFLEATNAQFWGSRELLGEDPAVRQSYALGTMDAQNFDFTEGYLRYDGGPVSVQAGRERVMWGSGYDQKMTLSDNVRVFDFLRGDARFGVFRYTFLHAWLLGRRETLAFSLPPDSSTVFTEPVVADKYFAGHRAEISLPGVLDAGAQEMVIYSNRAPDMAYLNPLVLIESAQRSREERDNVFWAFDVQVHAVRGLEAAFVMLMDDIHLADFFSDEWRNRYGYQAGIMLADPLTPADMSVALEYTRIEPWVFAHNRSRENDYGSMGRGLGPRIGPNADSWFLRLDWQPRRNLFSQAVVFHIREGENILDAQGNLIRNVGGDPLQPHRETDPPNKRFLDGMLVKTLRLEFSVSWEPVHQVWCSLRYGYERRRNTLRETTSASHLLRMGLRAEL